MPGRKKATQSPLEVGHGCVDCVAYELPMQRKPCSGCKNWSGWEPSQKYLDTITLRRQIEAEITNRRKKK